MARILVVDDEQHICDFYKTELTEMGHTVRSVSDGNNLLGKIEMFDPQLVILDIKLGAQNGLDLLCKIREKYSDLPVVMSTAYDSYKSERKALAADYYVVKSIDLSELKQSINRALEADITVKS